MDLHWIDETPDPIRVTWAKGQAYSISSAAPQLDFHPKEREKFPKLSKRPRFQHRVRLQDFGRGEFVRYRVHFPEGVFHGRFRTRKNLHKRPIRLVAYADSETEPESRGKHALWESPKHPGRRYLVDQSTGYTENLKAMAVRHPDAVLIAGDLVESGGEQRDWDEFWRHTQGLAAVSELLTAPGNHEYWAGPEQGGYAERAAQWAITKYRSYFHPTGFELAPDYYRKDLGPITVLSLNSNDGLPPNSETDSNHYLSAAPGFASSYHRGSVQWLWLEKQLRETQENDRFTIVMFHHCPYSSGTHGFAPGSGENRDEQSGQALREVTSLLLRYGVDLLLTGHDEMLERSELDGLEVMPDGETRKHILQIYDVGVGGDGLRGPKRENPHKKFLAYSDSKERWQGDLLVEGGRHYGFLEIVVFPREEGWEAKLSSRYVHPLAGPVGTTFLTRLYEEPIWLRSGLVKPR